MARANAGAFWILLIWGLYLLETFGPLEAQPGYDIVDDQIVVQDARHWGQWKRPTHLAFVDSAGGVRSRSLRTVSQDNHRGFG